MKYDTLKNFVFISLDSFSFIHKVETSLNFNVVVNMTGHTKRGNVCVLHFSFLHAKIKK